MINAHRCVDCMDFQNSSNNAAAHSITGESSTHSPSHSLVTHSLTHSLSHSLAQPNPQYTLTSTPNAVAAANSAGREAGKMAATAPSGVSSSQNCTLPSRRTPATIWKRRATCASLYSTASSDEYKRSKFAASLASTAAAVAVASSSSSASPPPLTSHRHRGEKHHPSDCKRDSNRGAKETQKCPPKRQPKRQSKRISQLNVKMSFKRKERVELVDAKHQMQYRTN